MAALPYTVVEIDQIRWGTLESIEYYLGGNGTKQLLIALDPLVTPSIINPAENYTFE